MKPFIDPKTGQLETRPAWADATLSSREWEKQLSIDDVLSKLPLKRVDRELAKRALEIFGVGEGLKAIAVSELLFPDFLRNKFQVTHDGYGEIVILHLLESISRTIDFGFAPLRLTAPHDKQTQVIWRNYRERPVRASLFDATFHVCPVDYACELGYFGLTDGLQLLIMDVPQADRDALRFHSNRDEIDLTFLPDGGVAALAFKIHSEGVEIHSLRSPLIEECRDPELRAKYRDWEKVLCAAFHYAVAQVCVLSPVPVPARVLYRSSYAHLPNTSTAFWTLGELSSSQKLLPEDLPISKQLKSLASLFGPLCRFETSQRRIAEGAETHLFGRQVLSDVMVAGMEALTTPLGVNAFLRWWSKHGGEHLPFHEILQYLEPLPTGDVRQWIRVHGEILRLDLVALEDKIPLSIGADRTFGNDTRFATTHLGKSIIHTPIQPLGRGNLVHVSQEAWDVHSRELKNPRYAEVLKLIGPEFVAISKGVEAGARSDWWTMEREHRVDLMHLPDQKRHPALRFSLPDGEKWSSLVVGIKGGGLRSLDDTSITPSKDGWRFPAYVRRPKSSRDLVLTTHELWGGMQLDEAIGEFTTTLLFQAFLRRHRPEGRIPMTTPIDVGILHHVPLWKGDGVRWVSPIEFIRDCARYASEQNRTLATFRSLGITEVRMLQLIDRVFLHERPKQATRTVLGEQILSALRYLYTIHGESLVVPDAQLGRAGEAISPREVLRFLHAVYTSNEDAAVRIRARVAEPLVWAHGLMHRNGGDLGGIYIRKGTRQFGAFGGGPAALRNLSIAGEMRDIDTQIRVPNRGTSGFDNNGMYQMERVRKQGDLVILADSLYWLDKILFGEVRGDPAIPREIKPFTRINSFVRFGSDDSHLDELKLKLRQTGPYAIQLGGGDVVPEDLLKGRDLQIYYGGI